MWVKAPAGAGKSFFAAIIADSLAKAEKVPVLFMFLPSDYSDKPRSAVPDQDRY